MATERRFVAPGNQQLLKLIDSGSVVAGDKTKLWGPRADHAEVLADVFLGGAFTRSTGGIREAAVALPKPKRGGR